MEVLRSNARTLAYALRVSIARIGGGGGPGGTGRSESRTVVRRSAWVGDVTGIHFSSGRETPPRGWVSRHGSLTATKYKLC